MAAMAFYQAGLECYGILPLDPGWIYAIRTAGNRIKIGKTKDPHRRLLGEAQTWSPEELEVIGVKPFWNIGRIEHSLHIALAEFWHRGEWHKFEEPYWMDFFIKGFRRFKDDEVGRDSNSIQFIYWFNSDNYAEALREKRYHRMSLRAWRQCRGVPYRQPPQKQAACASPTHSANATRNT
jgi:hypothetical protein